MRLVYTKVFGSAFSVAVVPTLQDNFSYLIHDQTSGTLAAVDVNSNFQPIIQQAQQEQLWGSAKHTFSSILTTHKHHDHAGGNSSLAVEVKKAWPNAEPVRVYGGANDHVQAATNAVKGGDIFRVGGLEVHVLDVPCHTRGHVAYHVFHPQHRENGSALFTGDTLFIGGLGAFFEGTEKDMCIAMERLSQVNNNDFSLDSKTFIFPGHEYTAGFMKFSAAEYPDKKSNDVKFILEQQQKYKALVSSGMPSVPSSLADEKRQNLFMRAAFDEKFQAAMGKGNKEQLMTYLYNACD